MNYETPPASGRRFFRHKWSGSSISITGQPVPFPFSSCYCLSIHNPAQAFPELNNSKALRNHATGNGSYPVISTALFIQRLRVAGCDNFQSDLLTIRELKRIAIRIGKKCPVAYWRTRLLRVASQHTFKPCECHFFIYLFTAGTGHANMTKWTQRRILTVVRLHQHQRERSG